MRHAAERTELERPKPDPSAPASPLQPLHHLDELWIQVAGTLCNLACTHCFVSSGPGIDRHALMKRAAVRDHVADAARLGVREVYFTGGEPFVHPEILDILADTLAQAPCTVLSNGTLFTEARTIALARMSETSAYSLEIRVSLDGEDAAGHDALRGDGAYARTIQGLLRLERHGLLPIVTVTQLQDAGPLAFRERWFARLKAEGLARPRLKVLPLFKLGREAERTSGYAADETLAGLGTGSFDPDRLQCGHCRAVTSRGVFVCPLLVDEPRARLGSRLGEALAPFALDHGACVTCWVTGMTCANS